MHDSLNTKVTIRLDAFLYSFTYCFILNTEFKMFLVVGVDDSQHIVNSVN